MSNEARFLHLGQIVHYRGVGNICLPAMIIKDNGSRGADIVFFVDGAPVQVRVGVPYRKSCRSTTWHYIGDCNE